VQDRTKRFPMVLDAIAATSAENETTNLQAAYTATNWSISVPTSREYRAKGKDRCIVARRVFEALCVQYSDKYVVLV
jgi:hypothetical protein